MRGRPPNLEPTRPITVRLNEKLLTRLAIELHSPAEGRVPKGVYQQFFEALLRRFWETQELDLSPYLSTLPGEAKVVGSPLVIERLKSLLERNQV